MGRLTGSAGAPEVVAGRYAIERELGRGGSAVVYLARDDARGGLVALKALHEEFSGSRAAERFVQEIRLLAGLEHPNIIPVSDSGEWRGRPFYVMRYVAGESLQERLRRERRLPIADVVALARAMCAALAYAHEHRIVHRDVKPANILLLNGAAYLTDFGVAKALEPMPGQLHSTTGTARGTRAYMSPEQAMADRDIDHRSDIYSLGCVLFETLAGQHPFQSADESRMLAMRFTENPDSLRRHRGEVSPALEAAIMGALQRDPADRWQSAKQFLESIERADDVGRVANEDPDKGRGTSRRTHLEGNRVWIALLPVAAGAAFLLARPASPGVCIIPELTESAAPRLLLIGATPSPVQAQPQAQANSEAVRSAISRVAGRWSDLQLLSDVPTRTRASGSGIDSCQMARHNTPIALAVGVGAHSHPDSQAVTLTSISREGTRSRIITVTLAEGTARPVLEAAAHDALRPSGIAAGPTFLDSATTSFVAWRSVQAGRRFLEQGELDSALKQLTAAAEHDKNLAVAFVWKAFTEQLRSPEAPLRWTVTASRALEQEERLREVDRVHARAIVDRAESRFPQACRALRAMSVRAPADHLGLLALAECIRTDSSLIVDSRNQPQFASSWEEAVRVLRSAMDRGPPAFHRIVFERLLMVAPSSAMVRWGWRQPATSATFAAYPALEAETTAFRPLPREVIQGSTAASVPKSLGAALQRGKRLQAEFARAWVERQPGSGAAHIAFARALELIGSLRSEGINKQSALQEAEEAARATTDRVSSATWLEARARLLLKLGEGALLNRLVDSVLIAESRLSDEETRVMAPLALMLGRVAVATRLLERSEYTDLGIPMSMGVRRDLSSLMALSAIGCCGVELERLEGRVQESLRAELDSVTSAEWEARLLSPSRTLGAACRDWTPALRVADTTDVIVRLQRMAASGNLGAIGRTLTRLQDDRRSFAAGDIAVDYLVQEALLYLATGDTANARRHVARWMSALPVSAGLELGLPAQAGAIARLAMIAKQLNVSNGGSTPGKEGARGFVMIEAMWSGADAWLREASRGRNVTTVMCNSSPPPMEER